MRYVDAGDGPAISTPPKPKGSKQKPVPASRRPFGPVIGAFVAG